MRDLDSDYHILHHALGISDPREPTPYRNHFVAGDGHADMPAIKRLCESGLMIEREAPSFSAQGDKFFTVTDKGKSIAVKTRPKPPKLTRGQKRYQEYLKSETSETFGEWLKNLY